MENQKVHEYTVETGPNGLPVARLGRVHNLIMVGFEGEIYESLDGRWVRANGQADTRVIPEEVKARVEAVAPPTGYGSAVQVLMHCEFCPDILASGEYAKHLANKHVRPALSNDNPIKSTETEVEGLDG